MKKIIAVMEEFITDAVLVSAYDAHYNEINPITLTFPSIVFLDSGGYEARVEHDLSEAYGKDYKPRPWSGVDHRQVLREWEMSVPTIAVSFDSPRRHTSVTKQVKAALSLKEEFPLFVHELLIKPEKTGQYIEIESIKTVLDQLAQFPIIGFTERELDTRIIGRMEKVATIRRLLDDAGISSPIHIFGSLDTLSTVLYFLAGAEIFDGLTWLRFGYHKGQTIYSQNYGAIRGENGILKNARELSHAMWKDNYYYLESLRDQMRNFVRTRDYKHFEHIASQVELAFHQLESRLLS